METDDWKTFINNLFVDADGRRKSARIALTLKSGVGELSLPPVEVVHSDSLQQIFRKVALAFDQQAATAAGEPEAATTAKTIDVEHIKHGKTEYIVYRKSDETFAVVKLNGDTVPPNTIVFNTVVKKYREKFNLQ